MGVTEESDVTQQLNNKSNLLGRTLGRTLLGRGHGNLLQCSCLENPMEGGAWCTRVHGATQRWTRLKQLSTCTLQCYSCFNYSKRFATVVSISIFHPFTETLATSSKTHKIFSRTTSRILSSSGFFHLSTHIFNDLPRSPISQRVNGKFLSFTSILYRFSHLIAIIWDIHDFKLNSEPFQMIKVSGPWVYRSSSHLHY